MTKVNFFTIIFFVGNFVAGGHQNIEDKGLEQRLRNEAVLTEIGYVGGLMKGSYDVLVEEGIKHVVFQGTKREAIKDEHIFLESYLSASLENKEVDNYKVSRFVRRAGRIFLLEDYGIQVDY